MRNQSRSIPEQAPDILHRLVRALVPRRARFALHYLRLAADSRGIERRENLARMYSCVGQYRRDVAVHDDIRLTVDLRDEGIGLPLWASGVWEDAAEGRFLAETLKPGDRFVDIGANIGYYTTLAARSVGPAGTVVAVEPSPYNYVLLQRNVTQNNLENVTPVHLALGDQPGAALLNLSTRNFGDNRIGEALSQVGRFDHRSVEIRVDTLDNLLRRLGIEHIDCIKMDVQGFEANVLEGMVETIARGTSTIMSEFWPKGIRAAGKDPAAYLMTYKEMGFTVALMTERGPEPVAWERIFEAVPKSNRPDAEWVNLVFRR